MKNSRAQEAAGGARTQEENPRRAEEGGYRPSPVAATELNHSAWTRETERRTCPACKATQWISPLEMVETEWICPVCEETLSTEIDPMILEGMEELTCRICD